MLKRIVEASSTHSAEPRESERLGQLGMDKNKGQNRGKELKTLNKEQVKFQVSSLTTAGRKGERFIPQRPLMRESVKSEHPSEAAPTPCRDAHPSASPSQPTEAPI